MSWQPDNARRPLDVVTVKSLRGRTVERAVAWLDGPGADEPVRGVVLTLDDGRSVEIRPDGDRLSIVDTVPT